MGDKDEDTAMRDDGEVCPNRGSRLYIYQSYHRISYYFAPSPFSYHLRIMKKRRTQTETKTKQTRRTKKRKLRERRKGSLT